MVHPLPCLTAEAGDQESIWENETRLAASVLKASEGMLCHEGGSIEQAGIPSAKGLGGAEKEQKQQTGMCVLLC